MLQIEWSHKTDDCYDARRLVGNVYNEHHEAEQAVRLLVIALNYISKRIKLKDNQ